MSDHVLQIGYRYHNESNEKTSLLDGTLWTIFLSHT
jgi:hypothetical protein